jgi:hypothetical protein
MEQDMGKIELHHHSIEEIMGTPPTRGITLGSGIIFIIFLFLLVGSMLIYIPDTIRVSAVIHGQTPIAVLTAPETGRIIFQTKTLNKQIVGKNEIFFYIEENATEQCTPVTIPVAGIFELNPLMRIRETVFQNDTIGYIWNEKLAPVVCVFQLSDIIAQNIQPKQKICVFPDTNEPKNFIEMELKEKTNWGSTNQTQFIAILPEQQLYGKGIHGIIHGEAEITIKGKNLFQ